jgi:hypothetical protein
MSYIYIYIFVIHAQRDAAHRNKIRIHKIARAQINRGKIAMHQVGFEFTITEFECEDISCITW